MRDVLSGFVLCCALGAQSLVVDRAPGAAKSLPVPVELESKQFQGDSFRIGDKGETWMMDSIRVWSPMESDPSCARLTLYGGLYNAPIPGVKECDCHAVIPITTAASVKPVGGRWQLDFRDVRWSVPGGLDVLFTVRTEPRSNRTCSAVKAWPLAAAPAPPDYRLRLFDKFFVPAGFAEPVTPPRQLHIQVWAHKY